MRDFLVRAEKLLPQEFASVFEEITTLGQRHSKANFDSDNVEFAFATFKMAALIGKMPHGRNSRCQGGLWLVKKASERPLLAAFGLANAA
jgi:hypothetical protein